MSNRRSIGRDAWLIVLEACRMYRHRPTPMNGERVLKAIRSLPTKAEMHADLREKAVQDGICHRCLKRPLAPASSSRCRRCLDMQKVWQARYVARLEAKGLLARRGAR